MLAYSVSIAVCIPIDLFEEHGRILVYVNAHAEDMFKVHGCIVVCVKAHSPESSCCGLQWRVGCP